MNVIVFDFIEARRRAEAGLPATAADVRAAAQAPAPPAGLPADARRGTVDIDLEHRLVIFTFMKNGKPVHEVEMTPHQAREFGRGLFGAADALDRGTAS